MRRDFDSGRATKTSRALAEKTSLVGVPLTKLVSSAASTSLPLPGAPVIRYACASRFCSWARRKNSSAVVRAKAISRIRYLCQHRKTRRKRFPNLFFNLVDVARAIDHDNALRLMPPRARDILREHAHKIQRAVVPSDPLCVAHAAFATQQSQHRHRARK